MNKKVKLIVNIIATLLFGASFISFFTDFIYVWILGIGNMGGYKGYEIALNFDGFPTNIGTLIPLLTSLGIFAFGIYIIIKDLITLKREPKKDKKYHPLLSALFFALFPLITFFCVLSTSAMLNLPAPKRYGGYYMAPSIYIVAYCSIVGGLMFFITESGIFMKKDNEPIKEDVVEKENKVIEEPVEKKEEIKPAPKAPAPKFKLRCKKCGTMFMSGVKTCPHCGAEVNPTNMVRVIPTSQTNKK